MPTLLQSLHQHDFGHLRIIAQLWGLDLAAKDSKEAREELEEKLLDAQLAAEIVEALPTEAHTALDALIEHKGRMSWALFSRRFGEIREVGPARRDREEIHLNPISAAETLYYRALLARAFFDSPNGAQEFAYLPDDLLKMLRKTAGAPGASDSAKPDELGYLARPDQRTHIRLANDHLLDDMTTVIAALRLGWKKPPYPLETSLRFILDLLPTAGIIAEGSLQTEPVKAFVEGRRDEILAQLLQAWRESATLDELRQLPGLIFEGAWTNPVLDTRQQILTFLETVPREKWWNLNAFVAAIKERHPDFQRTAGDYDAWFIRRKTDDTPLRGFSCWDEIEGALIRYLISGPLHWLGMVDLASAKEDGPVSAFRLRFSTSVKSEDARINVSSSGAISVPRYAPRVARYIIARFCSWEAGKNAEEYRYQITPSALEAAREQGLKITHLIGTLQKYASGKVSPRLVRALQRWEVNGTEARVERISVLRLSKPEDLQALRKSKAGRFLGEALGPTAVIIQPEAADKIMTALAEMGIFMRREE